MKSRKVNSFVQAAMDSSTARTLYKALERNKIRLDKLFLDQDLNAEQVDEGLQNLTGRQLGNEEFLNLKGVYSQIYERNIGIVISTRFSVFNIPGFLQIPYNFQSQELTEVFKKDSNLIEELLMDYRNFAGKTNKIMKFMSEVTVPCTLGRYIYRNSPKYETQTFEQSYISAKNLGKIVERGDFPRGIKDCILILGREYDHKEGFIEIPLEFNESELLVFLTKIINGQKL